jgi:CBS domain-containing protein/GGDEF domain-containing protein/Flp pilus assembly pilin Flp
MHDSQGTTAVSYAVMLVVVVGSALTGATLLGSRVERAFSTASTGMSNASALKTAGGSATTSDRVLRRAGPAKAGVSRSVVLFLMFAVAIVSAAVGWLMLRPATKKTEVKPAPRKEPVEEKVLFTSLNTKRELLWMQLLADHDLLLKNRIEVCHVMTRDPITINKSTSGKRIADLIARHQVAHLIVCDEDKNLLGVVRASDHKLNPDALAAAIITQPEHSITPRTSLGAAISILTEHGDSFLPVVDKGKLCGLLTPTDLVLTLHCSLQLWFRVAQTREDSSHRAEALETTSQSMAQTADQLKLQIQKLPEQVKTVVQTGNATGLDTTINEMTAAMSQLMEQLDEARAQIEEQNSQIANLKAPTPDEATGAASREELDAVMAQLHNDETTDEESLSVILLVAGNYHQLLSEQGPELADEYLRALAECAARHLAAHDQIGRYRDDTLALLLPGSSSPAALKIGNRVTDAAELILKGTQASPPRLSIVSARSGESASDLIKRAEMGIANEFNKEVEEVEEVAVAEMAC